MLVLLYQKDLELSKSGALPRRQLLESQSKLADAQTQLARATSQSGVAQAETALHKAEVGNLVEVKTGLFEGDLVVSQRAPQLYAQSLKSKPANAHGEVKPGTSSQLPFSQLPPYLIWGLLPAVGIVGAVPFC